MPFSEKTSSLLKKLAKNPGKDSYDNLISSEEAIAEDVLVVAARTGNVDVATMSASESLEGRQKAVQDASETLSEDETIVIFDSHGDLTGMYEPGDIVISENGPSLDAEGHQNFWNLFMEVEEGEGRNRSIAQISNSLFGKAVSAVSDSFSGSETAMQFASVVKGFFDYGDATGDTAVLNNSTLVTFIMEGPTAALAGVGSKGSPETLSVYAETAKSQGVWNSLQSAVSSIFRGNFGQNGTLSIRSVVNQSTGNRVFVSGATTGGQGVSSIYQMLLNTAVSGIMSRGQIATVSANVVGEGMPVFNAMPSAGTVNVSNGASEGMPVTGNGTREASEGSGMPVMAAQATSQSESGFASKGMPSVNQAADSNDRGIPATSGMAKASSGLTGLGY